MASNHGTVTHGGEPAWVSPAGWGFLVAFCSLAVLALGPVFDTNDDPVIIGLLSGVTVGRAFDVSYLGAPLSLALQHLYAAWPSVPWYGLVIESCNVLSAGLWAALIASCRPAPVVRLGATAGLLVGYSYLLLRVNFMGAALSLFFAAVSWLWKLQIERAELRWRQAWLGAALGAGHMIRPSLQWLMLFFVLPCLGISSGGRNLRRLALVGLAAGALVLATVAGEHRRHAEPGVRELAAFNRARSLLVDIPRDPVPQALAAAGWTRADYDLAVRFGVYDQELYRVERVRAFLANAGGGGWLDRRLRTAKTYLLSRFHLLCLATLAGVLWLGRADRVGAGTPGPPKAARALAWCWIAAGTLALVATRFPPRAFVPLYLHIGELAFLAPLLPFRAGSRRPPGSPSRSVALVAVLSLLLVALVFWHVDARAGRARLAVESRELAAGVLSLGEDAILVPVGLLLEMQYADALAGPRVGIKARVPPGGWVVATPAFGEFLKRNGFASGQAFMRGLADDPRVVFAVRRSARADAQWLVDRLGERYAGGRRLAIDPLGPPADGPGYLFFRIRAEPDPAPSGVVRLPG